MAVDPNDPCAVATYLRSVYLARVSGESEQMIREKTGETEHEVRFHAPISLADLQQEIARYEELCSLQQGGAVVPKRFAIKFGARRRQVWPS